MIRNTCIARRRSTIRTSRATFSICRRPIGRSLQVIRDLAAALADRFTVPLKDRFDDVGNEILALGIDEQVLRNEVGSFLKSCTPVPASASLATVRWSVVLSSCLDPQFEEAFRLASERRFMSHEVTVVTDLYKAIPPRTVPVFKLLGSTERGDCAISSDSYALKRGAWSHAVRGFTELVRGASRSRTAASGASTLVRWSCKRK